MPSAASWFSTAASSEALARAARLRRVLGMAWGALWAFKLRSVFVILAVALGIAALTIIIASVDGARRKTLEIVEWFGPDAVLIFGGNIETRAVGQRTLTLTWADALSIERSLPGAYLVVPMRSKAQLTLRNGNRNMVTPVVVGATGDYAQAWNWPLAEGRDLSEEDVKHSAKVCLIGDNPARELFGDESPIGKVILVQDLPVQVVGRLSYRGFAPGGGGSSVDDRLIMPISTLTQRFHLERNYFRALRVKFLEPEFMDSHIDGLRSLLRHNHGLRPEDPDDFSIISASEVLKFLSMITGGIMVFLGITAGAAMLVGGFVLANLLFLSVSERREEIGLKKALGATSTAITVQFLAEAVLLTLIGAIVGIALGVAMGQLLAGLGVLEIRLSGKLFALGLASALAIALIFGLKPARGAAALDPIEALRGGG
ncbi:Macrolide export ATP-binding/permease protein MacB [Fundidesulfovibrio magnetotacticus]|uniref:Macrolide export ATP-binding/permease protein MacB n=1 Tax=Fundidesulfovibrio magnetotacticus TaxID=2730080 RepID=A0A6V8M1G2_9BACT|nr:ABC transporter permease [Fundidesulfovibrio magnetotacticus]GFK95687.1 Macrolide export ATP-binding/permease protein MacB [Fundidesulfovibrio magnetotacticus]